MKHSPETILRGLRALALTDDAFARIRGALASYADMHSVPVGVLSARTLPALSWLGTRQALFAFSFVGILVLSSGSVSFGAERALPGDALYGVKIHLNETLPVAFTKSPEEKARYSAKLADRRADEAVLLAEAGKLDAEAAAYLDEQVSLHVAASDIAASELEAEGDIAAALSVRTELEADLAESAALLHGPEAPSAKTMALQVESVMAVAEEASPRSILADRIDEKTRHIAEARMLAEASVLPGINAISEGADLAILREAPPAGTEGESASATMMMSVISDAATTTASTTTEVETNSKKAPLNQSGTDVTQSLWFKASQ